MKSPFNKYQVEAIATLYKILRSNGRSHAEAAKALEQVLNEMVAFEMPEEEKKGEES